MYCEEGRHDYLNALRREEMNEEMMQRLGFGNPFEFGSPGQGMSGGNPIDQQRVPDEQADWRKQASLAAEGYGPGEYNPEGYNQRQSNGPNLGQLAQQLGKIWNQYQNGNDNDSTDSTDGSGGGSPLSQLWNQSQSASDSSASSANSSSSNSGSDYSSSSDDSIET
jgi:hypothetical protein